MGVDAEMFVRIRGRDNWLAQEDERRAAYELLLRELSPEPAPLLVGREAHFALLRSA